MHNLDKTSSVYYFSTETCNVCKVLKPKLKSFLDENFPKLKMTYIDVEQEKELAAQLTIFAVPTIIIYFDGKEFLRFSRNINFDELHQSLERMYNLYFD